MASKHSRKSASVQGAKSVQAIFNEAVSLHQKGQLAQAKLLYEQILQRYPRHFGALHLLGVIAAQTGNLPQAVELIGKAIEVDPYQAAAYNNRGNALMGLRLYEAALQSYDRAIALKPDYVEAHHSRGNVLRDIKQPEAAVQSYDRAIALKPDFAEAHCNKGNALKDLKQFEAALQSHDRAIALRPNDAEAHNNRGIALRDIKRPEAAVQSYDRAIALKPDFAEAYFNRGNALWELKQYEAAVQSYDRAIALKPDFARAHCNRGCALKDLKLFEAALQSFGRAIALDPRFAEAYCNHGNALKDLKQYEAAVQSYDRAIALNPDFVDAYANRGRVLSNIWQFEAALDSYSRAFALNPDLEYMAGTIMHTKQRLCKWGDFEQDSKRLLDDILLGKKSVVPFDTIPIAATLMHQRKAAEMASADRFPLTASPLWRGEVYRHPKIRLAYLSADFYNHATAALMAELLELHDHSRFEVVGICYSPSPDDEMRQRVSKSFDRFFSAHDKSDVQIAQLIRDLEIDVAVDLKGHTQGTRLGIFSYRPAPIQVHYLGYPGTIGAPYIDYLVADPVLIPVEHQPFYTEKIAYLPDTYQVNDRTRKIADKALSREELGLPAEGFVFCCFNNNYKITPDIFDIWMRLLNRVEGSVLWLLKDNPGAEVNLRDEALKRGVSPDRLIFAPRMDAAEHLARHRIADLFLDTLPCNAHTTASDALWAGLPILTVLGATFAGRVAASLLSAIGLPELIAHSLEEYEELAVDMALHPVKLQAIKQKLAENRLTTALFDTPRFTRSIENAYEQMYQRYQAGLPPDHVRVANPN